MRERASKAARSLAGQLLVAHPALKDPNFRRTVVLMTTHNPEGAMGMVLNRPMHKKLAELGGDFALGVLSGVPLFQGGPVEGTQLILAAWRIQDQGFQLHLGIDPEKAGTLLGEEATHVRAFFGYSGWGAGQLEMELEHHTWIVADAPTDLFEQAGDVGLWRSVLREKGPEWRMLADEPDHPESN
jgi:putative transcriptional regulator